MKTRQALIALSLLAGLWACTPSNRPAPTLTPTSSMPASTSTFTPPPEITITPTFPACLTEPARVDGESISTTNPAQEFLIFLPPCYDGSTESYPVLYLLHGQTFTDDQWVRLGAAETANRLILSGEAPPFIIVFPDDRYWNLPPGPGFDDRLINIVIPFVDENYRSLADREHRALGGLSRGGGWTLRLGFTHPELFGALGLHSPAIFVEDGAFIAKWIQAIPAESRPSLWLDIGDNDRELGLGRALEETLTSSDYVHEFHVYSGDHSEGYWSLHVEEYLRWYVSNWNQEGQ